MRSKVANRVIAAAAVILLALLSAPTGSGAVRPRAGAVVSKPPFLNWPRVPGAIRYNIQLFKETARTTRKVLSKWPTRSRYQVRWHWRYPKRKRHFTVARYHWYVWPLFNSGYGSRKVSRSLVYGRPPVNTSPPTLIGEMREGATVTATPGAWTGLPAPKFSYRWQRCAANGTRCSFLEGASLPTYRVVAQDIDLKLKVLVAGTNIVRTVWAPSAPSRVVLAARPDNVERPRIVGHAHVGRILGASPGTWLSSRQVAYSYRWLRCNSNGRGCARIAGATGRAYHLRSGDAAHRLMVSVRATNSGGSSESTSARSPLVGSALIGTVIANLIRGTSGSDLIRAGSGDDIVWGGRGNDLIYGGPGADLVNAGPGADRVNVRDDRRDRVSCGNGEDTVRADRRDRVRSDCEHVIRG